MYISFHKLRSVHRDDLPSVVAESTMVASLWICVSERGDTIIADTNLTPHRYWDPKKKCWRDCGPNSVMIQENPRHEEAVAYLKGKDI